jgi:hypothetical protein
MLFPEVRGIDWWPWECWEKRVTLTCYKAQNTKNECFCSKTVFGENYPYIVNFHFTMYCTNYDFVYRK